MRLPAQSIVDDIHQQLGIWEDNAYPDDVLPKYDPTNAPDIEDIKKHLESPETEQLLKIETEKFGSSAQEVETAFRDVSRGLAKVATLATHAQQHETAEHLRAYQTRWDTLHKEYVELVWESRRVAGNARAIALDFASDFLSVIKKEKYSIEVKMKEIAAYRKVLAKDEEKAMNLSQSFKRLCDVVAALRNDIKDDKKWSDVDVTREIGELLDVIDGLEKELRRAKTIAISAGVAGVAFGIASRVVIVLGVVCPPLWTASLIMEVISSAATLGSGMYYSRVEKKRNELKKQLDKQVKAAETVSDIIAGVSILESDMSFILEKLSILAEIWAIIRADLQDIEKALELASGTAIEERFEKKIEVVAEGYKTLALALRLYETNVHIKHPE